MDAGLKDGGTDAGCQFESAQSFCARYGANCGTFTAMDLCGGQRTENCGSCTAIFNQPTTCGGGGVANLCGCTPLADAVQCRAAGANCGTLIRDDFQCGTPHCVASCGTCTGGAVCGGSGVANRCAIPSCVPETDQQFCARVGGASQPALDNCGVARVAACDVSASEIVFAGYNTGVMYDLDAGLHCVSGQVPLNPNCSAHITITPNLVFTTYPAITFHANFAAPPTTFLGPFESSVLPGLSVPAGVGNTIHLPDLSQPTVSFGGVGGYGVRDHTSLVMRVDFTRSAPLGTDCGQWVLRCYGKATYLLPP